jgi:vacuolar-type H+-ATPase subunit I/STV1
MYNAEQSLVENFTVPKSRGFGNFPIPFQYFAWNEATLAAEAFLDFTDQIWTTTIHDRLKELGALSINVSTFQHNDSNLSAAAALKRVIVVSKSDGFKSVVKGECNARLAEKVEELMEAEKQAESSELDEKTQAAIKMSLGEIKDSMATKEGLSHLEEVTQSNANEIKSNFNKIDENYRDTILKQSTTIEALQEANEKLHHHITIMDKKMMDRDERIKNQTFAISKLNEDVRKKAETIAKLYEIRSDKQDICLALLNQCKDILTDVQDAKKRKYGTDGKE